MNDDQSLQKLLVGIAEQLSALQGEVTGLREEMRGEVTSLRGKIAGLREEMHGGFARVDAEIRAMRGDMYQMRGAIDEIRDDLREVRTIQEAHGKEISHLREGVDGINRKLSHVGEILSG